MVQVTHSKLLFRHFPPIDKVRFPRFELIIFSDIASTLNDTTGQSNNSERCVHITRSIIIKKETGQLY
jgi:hypothetical protein